MRRPASSFPMRWAVLLGAGVLFLLMVGACAGSSDGSGDADRAASLGDPPAEATVSPAPTPDPARAARVAAKRLATRGHYAEAAEGLAAAGLDDEAERMERRGARALLRSARAALGKQRYARAKRLVTQSRSLHKTAASRTVLAGADAGIARVAAAARERRRLARIAHDQRTCSKAERRAVRDGAGTPPGCVAYAAEQAAEVEAEPADNGGGDCDPNYAGACLKPDSPDYDCAGGSGDGPDYTGPVQSVGDDPYDLDRDGDGLACETS
ncbi:hypothetical protein C8N24_6615 [Solirubrobacter pauli]|uniref:Excalibur calcium-binding domain-containing protein n=1 Tax=Solirubrobacter pauli TaxID=166793 RepID=A0A660KVB2_9ACTN|nr:hypothetical protein [Solirubrobacter pauli]RKQ84984.1 hypothetical protein C8N24_6615 [Solirubrobacter pauli]